MALACPSVFQIQASRHIQSTPGKVFRILSQVDEFTKAVPGISKIEFLSDQKSGVGTRFRETRTIQGKEASSELTVVEMVDGERIRLDSHAMGTHWSTLFTVTPSESNQTHLSMTTDARPKGILARLFLPMMLGMVRTALDDDLNSIHRYAESNPS